MDKRDSSLTDKSPNKNYNKSFDKSNKSRGLNDESSKLVNKDDKVDLSNEKTPDKSNKKSIINGGINSGSGNNLKNPNKMEIQTPNGTPNSNISSNSNVGGNGNVITNPLALKTPLPSSKDLNGLLNGASSPKSPGLNSIELIQLKNLNNLPIWLRNLRLHKYTEILSDIPWKTLIQFNDEDLLKAGVGAMGARRKLLKAFDIVKVAYANKDIIGFEEEDEKISKEMKKLEITTSQ